MAKKIDLSGFDEETSNNLDLSGFDEEVLEPTSKLESAARGAAQGLTFDLADELIGAGKAAYDIATDEPKLDDFKALYSKYRDIEREKFKKAREENPATYMASDIGAGIIPALFTGGATAAASIGKGAVKEGLKQAVKTGAKYGALTGLGVSEADIMKGELGQAAKDIAIGAGTGAAAGIAIPAAGKAIGATGKSLAKGAKELAEKFPTITKPFQFAAKYGMTRASKRQEILQKDVESLLDSFKDRFTKLGLDKKTAQEKASELQKTYDMTGDLQKVADRIREDAKMLPTSGKESAEKLAIEVESLFKTEQKLVKEMEDELKKEINKKLEKSTNKDIASQKKAEGKAVLEAEKKGLELEQINNVNKKYEDIAELPYETVGGRVKGGEAKFRQKMIDPETGEEVSEFFTKPYLEDVTPFKPSNVRIGKTDDQIIGEYMNEATGEVFRKYKQLPKQDVDFSKMTLEDILNWVRVTQDKAYNESGANAEMYKELWKIGRNALPEMVEGLPQNKQEFSKMYEILELLGIDKEVIQKGSKQYSSTDLTNLMKKLPSKMETEKSFIERNFLKKDDSILKKLSDIELTTDVNRIMEGSTSATGEFTRAGLAQRGTGLVSEIAGAVYGKVGKPVVNVAGKTIKGLHNMSDAALSSVQKKLQEKGLDSMSGQLQRAIEAEGPLRNALLWSMSQQPAIRKMMEDSDENLEEDFASTMGNTESPFNPPKNPTDEASSSSFPNIKTSEDDGSEENEINREPSGKEDDYDSYTEGGDLIKTSVKNANKFIKNNDKNLDELSKSIIKSEGYIPNVYKDSLKNDTIGIGHLITKEEASSGKIYGQDYTDGLDEKEALIVLQKDLQNKINEARTLTKNKGVDFDNLSNQQQMAIIEAVYQLGGGSFSKFPKLWEAMKSGDYKKAASEAQNSRWFKQTPERVNKFVDRISREDGGLVPDLKSIKSNLDRIMKMKSSGMETPEYEIEKAFDGINQMDISEEDKLDLQNEVVQIESFSDVERIKSLLDKIGRKS